MNTTLGNSGPVAGQPAPARFSCDFTRGLPSVGPRYPGLAVQRQAVPAGIVQAIDVARVAQALFFSNTYAMLRAHGWQADYTRSITRRGMARCYALARRPAPMPL